MPRIQPNDTETYYERHGEGESLILTRPVGRSPHVGPQIEILAERYEVIVYDIRGHGERGSSKERRYSIELFAAAYPQHVERDRTENPEEFRPRR